MMPAAILVIAAGWETVDNLLFAYSAKQMSAMLVSHQPLGRDENALVNPSRRNRFPLALK
jgi:hypothetical protein